MNTYCWVSCPLCGQIISYNGLSQGAHYNMHVREGYMVLVEWNPNRYERTSKPFDREEYQKARPEKAYNLDDYFPAHHGEWHTQQKRKHDKKMIARKGRRERLNDGS